MRQHQVEMKPTEGHQWRLTQTEQRQVRAAGIVGLMKEVEAMLGEIQKLYCPLSLQPGYMLLAGLICTFFFFHLNLILWFIIFFFK